MISRSSPDLMDSIELLEEDEESEAMWQDEVRESDHLMRDIWEWVEIESVAPTDHEDDMLAMISLWGETSRDLIRREALSSLVTEIDDSLVFLEDLSDLPSLLSSDIVRTRVSYGPDRPNLDRSRESSDIGLDGDIEVLISIRDVEESDFHHMTIR